MRDVDQKLRYETIVSNLRKRRTTLISAILLSLLISTVASARDVHTIPVKLKGSKTLVSVKIGNVVIPNVMLDTGMPVDGVMIYNPDYQDSLDLKKAIEVTIGGAGSGNSPKSLMIEHAEFYLGDFKLTDQRIIMLQSDIYKGFPTNGIIGYSIFGHHVTEINYDNNTMTLSDSIKAVIDNTWTVTPIYFKDNDIPWIDVYVAIGNEKPVRISAYIDFAMEDNIVLLEKPKMKFKLPENTVNKHLGTGLSGDIYGKSGKISLLNIGSYDLNYVTAAIAPLEVRSKQDNADAIIGSGTLKRFNIVFDYADKKLYLKPNMHFNE